MNLKHPIHQNEEMTPDSFNSLIWDVLNPIHNAHETIALLDHPLVMEYLEQTVGIRAEGYKLMLQRLQELKEGIGTHGPRTALQFLVAKGIPSLQFTGGEWIKDGHADIYITKNPAAAKDMNHFKYKFAALDGNVYFIQDVITMGSLSLREGGLIGLRIMGDKK